MSLLAWLQRQLVSQEQPEDPNVIPDLDDEEPFVFTQHMRIITAILFCVISAGVLWWIMT